MSQQAEQDAQLKTIERFYTCFQNREPAGMAACYHTDIVFSDPAFGTLRGREVSAMWHMLNARAKDLSVSFGDIRADGKTIRAHWEARYPFSRTGRPVHNVIEAAFRFQDGLIIRHDDTFDFWRWQRMALGTAGVLLGWTPFMQNKVRKTARAGLDDFIAKNPAFKN